MAQTPQFSLSSSVTPEEINLKELIENLLLVLSDKEKYIIKHRFALHNTDRRTLEKIGDHFKVTRERIRQIKNNALRKLQRNALNTNLKIINEFGKDIIKKNGGVLLEKKLLNILIDTLKSSSPLDFNEIKLSLTLDPDLVKTFNTLNFYPHWRLKSISFDLIKKIVSFIVKFLESKKDVVKADQIIKKVQTDFDPNLPPELISSILEIDKRIKIIPEGVGLMIWRHINPRTLFDKINYILEKEKTPLHFVKIANKIIETQFDQKTINTQAVHNELIRNLDFILIGRGIYALKKWGYKKGTVCEVIQEFLKDGEAKTREEIMETVLKQRQVKRITIYLNLKNHAWFKKVGKDSYQLIKKR